MNVSALPMVRSSNSVEVEDFVVAVSGVRVRLGVTVVVVDVLPNRNLVVMGTRSRNIAGDIQTIEVSGIVRPSDIAFDNTIKSEQIADFRIVTKNSGISAPYTRPGWLGKIFDVIWPF